MTGVGDLVNIVRGGEATGLLEGVRNKRSAARNENHRLTTGDSENGHGALSTPVRLAIEKAPAVNRTPVENCRGLLRIRGDTGGK